MGRNKHCSVEKRKLIVKLHNEGHSFREIGKLIDCSLGMVQNALRYKIKQETRGRPRKTSTNTDRFIVRNIIKNPFASASQVLAEVKADISVRTVRRRLVENNLKSYSPRKVPLLKKRHLKDSIKFARDHLELDSDQIIKKWRNILFSDESKFMLFNNDGKAHVRRPKSQAFNPKYTKKTVKYGGGKILIWACFSWYGVGPIVLIDDIMTKEIYINILKTTMLPYADWNMPVLWIFQQNNDPKHTAKASQTWLRKEKVKLLDWPAQSPDLNPIENLWKQVKDKIKDVRPRNKVELWTAVKETWYTVPIETCRRLINSMPNRCRAVLRNKGHAIDY